MRERCSSATKQDQSFQGSVDVGSKTMLVWVHRKKVGPFMNALHFLFGLGAFIGPIVVAQTVMMSGDINLAYWVVTLILMPIVVWILRIPSPVPAYKAEEAQLNQEEIRLIILIALFFSCTWVLRSVLGIGFTHIPSR